MPSYRQIITSKFRTQNLVNFMNKVGDSADKNQIYLSFGKEQSWSDRETEQDFSPPMPLDNTAGIVDVWNNMVGIIKIPEAYFDAVIPRKDWGDQRYATSKTFYINDIIAVNTGIFNQVAPGEGIKVYRCVDVPAEGECSIDIATDKITCSKFGGKWTPKYEQIYAPRGTGDAIDMEDGYKWEYLYQIPVDVVVNRVTNEYLVVPMPDELQKNPEKWGYKNVLSWDSDNQLVFRTKCNTLRFKAYMDSIYFPETTLPGNTGFRQLGLIMNPEMKEQSSKNKVKATGNSHRKDDLLQHSGELLYIENRTPIIRQMDQTEEVQIFFKF